MYRANLTPSKLYFLKNLRGYKKIGADLHGADKVLTNNAVYRQENKIGHNLLRPCAKTIGQINKNVSLKELIMPNKFKLSGAGVKSARPLTNTSLLQEEILTDSVSKISNGVISIQNFSKLQHYKSIISSAEIQSLQEIYPFPLNILRKVYDIVANEINNDPLQQMFTQKKVSQGVTHWDCTYLIKWPTEMVFSVVADTKRSASSKCALQVLHYLRSTGRLTQSNKPIFEIDASNGRKCAPEMRELMGINLQNQVLDQTDLRNKILNNQIKQVPNTVVQKRADPVLISNSVKRMLPENDLRNKILNKQMNISNEKITNASYNLEKDASLSLKKEVRSKKLGNDDATKLRCLNALQDFSTQNQRNFSSILASTNLTKPAVINEKSQVLTKSATYLTTKELIALYDSFPYPTTILHNFYDTLSEVYKNPNFILRPSFLYKNNNNNEEWECTYQLQWPKDLTFIDSASTQQIASSRCTLQILNYLHENKYLTKELLLSTKLIADKFAVISQTNKITETRSCGYSKKDSDSDGISDISEKKLRNKASINKKVISTKVPDHFAKKGIAGTGLQIKLLAKQLISLRAYSTSTQNETNQVPEVLTKADQKKLLKLFPNPKNILHSVFDIVSKELNNRNYKLSPMYSKKQLDSKSEGWECTYHIKWPAELRLTEVARTKQEASTRAALSVLNYLKLEGKLTKQKQPILYEHEEVVKQKVKTLTLHPKAVNTMRGIVDFYKSEFVPLLVNSLPEEKEDISRKDLEMDWLGFRETRRRFRDANFYACREVVKLPISDFKTDIMDVVRDNRVVVVKGEPGCGKSTRVPQYILESWANEERLLGRDCRIIVTQPRRIAAISLAERVANERNEMVGSTIGYHVRLKSSFNNKTGHVLYCTTGILLRRLQSDPNLSDCTHIIIDEAHERDVNTDLLLNLLRRAVETNHDLKVIIMSATIDAETFKEYFDSAALIHIPGFTYPVKVNFLDVKNSLNKTMEMCNGDNPEVVCDDVAKLIKFIHKERSEGAILCFLPGWGEIMKVSRIFEMSRLPNLAVYCLHSRMQDSDQRLIFSKPPPGVRKVILATNIAETSVTIDDVVYVIDTGIEKEKRFDVEKGISCIDNRWISKSSMAQRKGRAGRVQSGESFHLYPQTKFKTFDEYSTPEILRTSLTKIVLDSKAYSNNAKATEFLSELLNPPETSAILKAVDELKELELLDADENLTPLGRVISEFQLEPSLGKAMVHSVLFKCITPIIDIVTLFSAETELFIGGLTHKEDVNKCKQEFSKSSDHLSMMRIFEKWLEFIDNGDNGMAMYFCRDNNLIEYKLHTIRQLRGIHFEYLNKGLLDVLPKADDYSDNDELVKAVLLSGVGHVLQHRNFDIVKGRLKKSNVLLTRNNHKATISSDSVNYKRSAFPTNFLLYINETRSNIRRSTTVRETSLISPLSVFLFKNNKIIIDKVPEKYLDDDKNPEEYVLLKLENTNIECVCDKKQAKLVKECKESLNSGMQYYIYQLTKGGEYNEEINSKWDDILRQLNEVLTLQGIDNR